MRKAPWHQGAHGRHVSSHDGRIESIVTLEDSRAVEEAEMPTPSRASVAAEESSTPQPRGGRGRGGRPPRPSDVDDEAYRAATQEARDKKKRLLKRSVKLKKALLSLRTTPSRVPTGVPIGVPFLRPSQPVPIANSGRLLLVYVYMYV